MHITIILKSPNPPILLNINTNSPPLHIRWSSLLSICNSLNITLIFIGNVNHEAASRAAVEPASTEVQQILTAGVFSI
jgi:hypothetical protein